MNCSKSTFTERNFSRVLISKHCGACDKYHVWQLVLVLVLVLVAASSISQPNDSPPVWLYDGAHMITRCN